MKGKCKREYHSLCIRTMTLHQNVTTTVSFHSVTDIILASQPNKGAFKPTSTFNLTNRSINQGTFLQRDTNASTRRQEMKKNDKVRIPIHNPKVRNQCHQLETNLPKIQRRPPRRPVIPVQQPTTNSMNQGPTNHPVPQTNFFNGDEHTTETKKYKSHKRKNSIPIPKKKRKKIIPIKSSPPPFHVPPPKSPNRETTPQIHPPIHPKEITCP